MSRLRNTVRPLFAAVAKALSHPELAVRIAAAMGRGDGAEVARLLPDPWARPASLGVMQRCGVFEVSFATPDGQWRTDLGDAVGQSLWLTHGYEQDSISALVRWLGHRSVDSGIVVDLGANIGTTSIPFAQAGFGVLAVEPVPHTYSILVDNVRSNHCADQIRTVKCAVSVEPGEVQMWTGFGSGVAEVAIEGEAPGMERWGPRRERFGVPAAPLNSILADHGINAAEVALVWADVQGSETAVIRSGTELWLAGVPLYLEVDPSSLEQHSGIDGFIDAVQGSFTGFIERRALVARGLAPMPRPIAEFGAWVGTLTSGGPNSYSDALLIS
jgi:FkbM family methyltransferase